MSAVFASHAAILFIYGFATGFAKCGGVPKSGPGNLSPIRNEACRARIARERATAEAGKARLERAEMRLNMALADYIQDQGAKTKAAIAPGGGDQACR